MKSSAPTISDSVELWVLSFCLVKLTMGNLLPKDRLPPLCPHMLGWTANVASTHHFKMPVPLALRIRGSMYVCMYVCMYVWPDHFWHTPLLELRPSVWCKQYCLFNVLEPVCARHGGGRKDHTTSWEQCKGTH
jgi:hypothetical protein